MMGIHGSIGPVRPEVRPWPTDHVAKDGAPKIVQQCTLPLTGLGVVDRIITDRAVLDVTPTGLRVAALAPGTMLDELDAVIGCRLRIGATA